MRLPEIVNASTKKKLSDNYNEKINFLELAKINYKRTKNTEHGKVIAWNSQCRCEKEVSTIKTVTKLQCRYEKEVIRQL